MLLMFSDNTLKIKSKTIVLSVVSLFVGMTEALPKKFTLTGLDLSNNQEVLGWFIFYATLILLINLFFSGAIELIEHYLPSLIKKEVDKTVGGVLGLTVNECLMGQEVEEPDNTGTVSGEMEDIRIKNVAITNKYKKNYINTHDLVKILFEFVGPIVFSVFGLIYLYMYISSL